MQIVARRFDNRRPVRLEIAQRCIESTTQLDEPAGDSRLPWVAPGWIDLQVNGYNGQEFSSFELTPEKVLEIVRRHFAFGVTSLCPTLTTQSFDCLVHGMQTIDFACRTFPHAGQAVAGIHLEGPYFDSNDGPRGAHPKEHCRRPTWEEFEHLQQAAGGRIRLLTMSPHFEDAPAFIRRVTASGVIVAVGHTGADGCQIAAAVDAGARLSTHLGNGAHQVLRRHPNYIWDQLAEDRLMASLIVDGHHLPPEVVKAMVRAKTPERCVLVSDVSGLAGLPPGRHASSGGDVEVMPDGRLLIAGQDQLLAGASAPIGVGIANVMHFAGVDLRTAVAMAVEHPSRLLGERAGSLRPGDNANLVLFDLETEPRPCLTVRATVSEGEVVFGTVT